MQGWNLNRKIQVTQTRIIEWYKKNNGNVYVSFSGGKDSTVLLHIARQLYPDVPAVFVDTGLEYPEIREFVKSFSNVTWLKPKMNFKEVIKKYGYPVISKEVAECIYGARRYLEKLKLKESLDRQTEPFLIGTDTKDYADLVSMQNPSRGGYDNKYRKLRGIGEYSSCNKRNKRCKQGNRQCSNTENFGDSSEKRESNDGEYP